MSAHDLKALQVRQRSAEAYLSLAREELKSAESKIAAAKGRVASIKAQIAKLSQPNREIVVSEHALLRYIERVYGIDLDELRADILSVPAIAMIDEFGSGKIPCQGGRLVVKDRVVVTVETA